LLDAAIQKDMRLYPRLFMVEMFIDDSLGKPTRSWTRVKVPQ